MNRTSTIALIVLAALIMLLIWSGKLNFLNNANSVSDVIPETSLLAFKVNDLSHLRQIADDSKFVKTFDALAWVNNFNKSSSLIDELLNLELGNYNKQNLVASLHAVKSGQYGFLYLIDTKNIGTNPFKLFRRSLKSDNDQMSTSRFQKTLIYHTKTGLADFGKMSFSECNGVILFSKHATLVEEGIKAILDGDVINNTLIPVYKNSKNPNSLGFLLNANNLKLLLTPDELNDKSLINNQIVKLINSFNGDLVINKNRLVANGKVNIQNNENLKALQRHLPVTAPTLVKKIPADCAAFTFYNVSSFQEYFDDYLESLNILNRERYAPYLIGTGNEFAKVKQTASSKGVSMLSIDNIDLLKKNYVKISAAYNSGSDFDIRKLDDNAFGNLLTESKNDLYYYCILGSAVLISSSKYEIDNIANKIVSGNSFDKSLYYTSYKENFMLKSSLIHYENPQLLESYYKNGWEELQNKNVSLEKIYPLFIQLYDVKKEFNLNAVVGFEGAGLDEKEEFEKKKKPIYETKPDLTSKSKPRINESKITDTWANVLQEKAAISAQPFVNHYTKEAETFIQDINNTIYLLSKQNEIIWQRNITSQVKTPITMVDFLKNNKNQLLFNTTNRLFLLDRNGNGVKPFPKTLPANAANAIKRVYYKDAKKERLYFAGQDGKTYALDRNGNSINGWLNNINVGKVELPMSYVNSRGKDYLCFINTKKQLYIFNRKGELRKEPINLNLKGAANKVEVSSYNGKTQLLITDIKETKVSVDLN